MVNGRLGLFLSVDNLQPTSGNPDVDFGLTARTFSPTGAFNQNSGVIADIEISVELSDGLKFKDSWTPPAGFTKTGSQSGTWNPDDVTGDTTNTAIDAVAREIDIETELTGDSLDAIPLEERCITARVTDSKPPPEPGYVLGSFKQCLGDDPTVLFEEGDLDLFTLHPCVGVDPIAHPCRDENNDGTADNGLELVVGVTTVQQGAVLRRKGIAHIVDGSFSPETQGRTFLRPENVVVWVKDPEGRVVNGSSVSWQTSGGDINSGVSLNQDLDVVAEATGWSDAKDRVTATAADGITAKPGTLSIKFQYCDPDPEFCHTETANADNTDFSDAYPFSDQYGTYSAEVFYEMGALGTFLTTRSYKGTKNSNEYTAIAKFVIHVGPIAELTVEDGGASPELTAGQRAFTIVAVNNGPDDAPAAQVTVSGLNAGDYVSHSATAGSFDSTAGVWSVGELRESGHYQDTYGRNGEVLTIVTSADAGAEITAEIENTRDYRVCIDSSGEDVVASSESACTATSGNTWHTTEYYDYLDDNNSATITAKSGTGADLPSLRRAEPITGIKVSWDPVDEVNGRTVTHYEVQRRTNPWETIAKVIETNYVDADVALGQTYQYRVRGVNQRGQTGPWSSSSGRIEAEVALPLPTGPVRILRIEPSIGEVSLRGGDLVRLAVEVYGRQDLRDDSLGDRSDVTFDWTLEEFGMQPGGNVGRLMGAGSSGEDGSRISALDDRRVLYIAPDSPGRFRIKVSLDPGTECFPRREFETNEDVEERCSAIFEVTALRSAHVDTATLDPRNPEGPIPLVLADSHGQQYEVFTPEGGGTFVGDTTSLTAKAGAVPDDELIGLRISEIGPATNEGGTHQRYTLGGDLYAVAAVDASGERVQAYELNNAVEVCVPLPPELRSNLSDLALVATNPDDSLTILATRVRISTSGTNVCGQLSTVPAQVAVGTSGALSPLPTAFPGASGQTGTPDTGGWTPSSLAMAVWIALLGLTVLVVVFGLLLQRRRKTDWSL